MKPGDTISNYEIIERVGAGGMGEVFKARDTRLRRVAALKILPPQVQTDRETRERFFQEARAAASLNHPNICTIYDADEVDGQAFIAMEYIEGETLRDFLSSRPADDPARSMSRMLALGYQVARGLDKAHRTGIVHRDIKPANVMVSREGEAKILDFGLAKLAGGMQLTQAGSTVGTAAYMSPEQARGEDVDARSDLWSLGVILYEMLGGERPFKGDYDSALVYAILNETPRPLREVVPDVPAAVGDLVDRLMDKEPANRPSSATEVMEILAAHASSVSFVAASSAGRDVIASPKGVSRGVIAAAAGVFVVIVAAALWFALVDGERAGAGTLPTSENVIAVLPFSVRGSADLDYLGEGMVSLLSTKLNGAGDLRTVDSRALQAAVDQGSDGGSIDPVAGERIARRFGAGRFVLGDVIELGGQVEITANVYDVDRSGEALGGGTVEGAAGDVFALVDRLASQLLVVESGRGSGSTRDLASLTTNSLPALKAYLEGENDFRKGDFGRAVAAFSRAVELDSTFALAYYRLSIALEWGPGSPEQVHEAAVQAQRLGSRLSQKDRRLLDAFGSWRQGLAEEAESKYVSYLSVYPDDVEALFQLGEIKFHTRALRGESRLESRDEFERVVQLEPHNAHAMLHLARLAREEGDREELERLRKQVTEISPDSRLPVAVLLLIASMPDEIGEDSIVVALESIDDEYRDNAFQELWYYGHDFGVARRLVKGALPVLQNLSFVLSAALGQMDETHSELKMDRRSDPVGSLVALGGLAGFPMLGASKDSISAVADLLAATGDDVAVGVTSEAQIYAYRVGKMGLIGELMALAGRGDEALQYARRLSEQAPPLMSGTFVTDGVKYVQALVALERGDEAQALDVLEEMQFNVNYLFVNHWGFFGRDGARFRLAELLDRNGRQEDALRWFRSIAEDGVALVAPAHMRAAEILDRLGRTEEAIANYDEFVRIWSDADARFQPAVEEAVQRREALVASLAREPVG